MDNLDVKNLKQPTISELIKVLDALKDEIGDVTVFAAYDGWWGMDVSILRFDKGIIIGSIS